MTKIEATLKTMETLTGHGVILEIPLVDLREQQAEIDRLRARDAQKQREVIEGVIRDVAELPDRTSPADWPEAMLVTEAELRAILLARLTFPPLESAAGGAPDRDQTRSTTTGRRTRDA